MAEIKPQNYANHRRFVPVYHFVYSLLALAILVGALYNVYRAWNRGSGRLEAGLVLLIAFCLLIIFWYARIFPLKAQDRAIRAEENFRHYLVTGSPLDSRLTTRQIIGLRFASDEELGELAKRAAEEGLSEDQIKKAVKNWRVDHYRV